MSHFAYTTAQFFWNSVDLSAHVMGADLEATAELVEDGPTMGMTTRKRLPIIKDWTLTVRFKQDFAAAMVDATLRPDIVTNMTERAWRLRGTSGAISATNPEFQGTGFIESYSPLRGDFGEVVGTEIVVRPGTTPDLVTDITP